MYASIPVSSAVAAVRNKLTRKLHGAIPEPLLAEDVIWLLGTIFGLTFHCEGRVYRQASGLPMGCAVSGIVAIIFMESIEMRAVAQFARCPLF